MSITQSTPIKEVNPFKGCTALLGVFQSFQGITNETTQMAINNILNPVLQEYDKLKDVDFKKLYLGTLFSMCISVREIVDRSHWFQRKEKATKGGRNLVKPSVHIYNFLIANFSKEFYTILPLLPEYASNKDLTRPITLRTDRYKGKLLEKLELKLDVKKVIALQAKRLASPKVDMATKDLIWRWFPMIPKKNRYRKDKEGVSVKRKSMLPETVTKNEQTNDMITKILSELKITKQQYRTNRSLALANTEAHLFSSKKVLDMDKAQFIEWLFTLTGGQRDRVKRRICKLDEHKQPCSSKKWINEKYGYDLGETYLKDFIAAKEDAMKKQLVAQEKVKEIEKKGVENLTAEEKVELKKTKEVVAKNKKIATMSSGNFDWYTALCDAIIACKKDNMSTEANLVLQSMIEKIKDSVPKWCIIDVSGSMSRNFEYKGNYITALDVAIFITALQLYTNPDEQLSNQFTLFASTSMFVNTLFGKKLSAIRAVNKYNNGEIYTINKITDKSEPFIETYKRVRDIVFYYASKLGGSTDLPSVAKALWSWINEENSLVQQKRELLNRLPVQVIMSDGDLNGYGSASSTFMAHQNQMIQNGWSGVTVILDAIVNASFTPQWIQQQMDKFKNVPNFKYYPCLNPSLLSSVFEKLSDDDLIDIYVPLLAFSKMERYSPIRDLLAK